MTTQTMMGRSLVASLILFAIGSASPMLADSAPRLVAWSNSPASELGAGLQFTSIQQYAPRLDHFGRAVFTGRLTDPSGISSSINGILREASPGQLEVVVQLGDAASGAGAEATFNLLQIPEINGHGQVALGATIAGTGIDEDANRGIWREGANQLELIVREGDAAPGTPPGVVFDAPPFFNYKINDSGEVVFTTALAGPGVTDDNDAGIWRTTEGGGLARVVNANAHAPGTPPGVRFDFARVPEFSHNGQVAFFGALNGPGVNNFNDRGIWTQLGDGPLELAAREGDPAPGAPGAIYGDAISVPAINSNGRLAFVGSTGVPGVGIGRRGLVSDRGGNGLEIILERGDLLPDVGPGVEFDSSAGFVVINDHGRLAFPGRFDGPGVNSGNNTGLFNEGQGGDFQLVAREGDQPPGTEAGVEFSDLSQTTPVINRNGQLAFRAFVDDQTGNFVGDGIWAQDSDGQLHLIVRQGDLLSVSEDAQVPDFRTVTRIEFADHTGNGDGRATGFNNLGQVAFGVSFSDGTRAVYVSDLVAVPEPTGLALVLLGPAIPLLLCRGRRGRFDWL